MRSREAGGQGRSRQDATWASNSATRSRRSCRPVGWRAVSLLDLSTGPPCESQHWRSRSSGAIVIHRSCNPRARPGSAPNARRAFSCAITRRRAQFQFGTSSQDEVCYMAWQNPPHHPRRPRPLRTAAPQGPPAASRCGADPGRRTGTGCEWILETLKENLLKEVPT
jgi:hypothetical protein